MTKSTDSEHYEIMPEPRRVESRLESNSAPLGGNEKSTVMPLVCPQCGADLDVPEGVSILRCKFCGTKSKLKETDSVRALVLLGDKLDEISTNTSRAADGIDGLHQHAERTAEGVQQLNKNIKDSQQQAWKRWNDRLKQIERRYGTAVEKTIQAEENLAKYRRSSHRYKMTAILGVPIGILIAVYISDKFNVPEIGSYLAPIGLFIFVLFIITGVLKEIKANHWARQIDSFSINKEGIGAEYEQWKLREPL